MKETGCVYLVGAGCGSADLITVRGLRLLQSCGAVVYDALIDPALLEEAPLAGGTPRASAAAVIPCPRRRSAPCWCGWPGRGKPWCGSRAGDPFVFGRGGEEILAPAGGGDPL